LDVRWAARLLRAVYLTAPSVDATLVAGVIAQTPNLDYSLTAAEDVDVSFLLHALAMLSASPGSSLAVPSAALARIAAAVLQRLRAREASAAHDAGLGLAASGRSRDDMSHMLHDLATLQYGHSSGKREHQCFWLDVVAALAGSPHLLAGASARSLAAFAAALSAADVAAIERHRNRSGETPLMGAALDALAASAVHCPARSWQPRDVCTLASASFGVRPAPGRLLEQVEALALQQLAGGAHSASGYLFSPRNFATLARACSDSGVRASRLFTAIADHVAGVPSRQADVHVEPRAQRGRDFAPADAAALLLACVAAGVHHSEVFDTLAAAVPPRAYVAAPLPAARGHASIAHAITALWAYCCSGELERHAPYVATLSAAVASALGSSSVDALARDTVVATRLHEACMAITAANAQRKQQPAGQVADLPYPAPGALRAALREQYLQRQRRAVHADETSARRTVAAGAPHHQEQQQQQQQQQQQLRWQVWRAMLSSVRDAVSSMADERGWLAPTVNVAGPEGLLLIAATRVPLAHWASQGDAARAASTSVRLGIMLHPPADFLRVPLHVAQGSAGEDGAWVSSDVRDGAYAALLAAGGTGGTSAAAPTKHGAPLTREFAFPAITRAWCLRATGWRVVHVPFFVWHDLAREQGAALAGVDSVNAALRAYLTAQATAVLTDPPLPAECATSVD
jgi:hypothetical protein